MLAAVALLCPCLPCCCMCCCAACAGVSLAPRHFKTAALLPAALCTWPGRQRSETLAIAVDCVWWRQLWQLDHLILYVTLLMHQSRSCKSVGVMAMYACMHGPHVHPCPWHGHLLRSASLQTTKPRRQPNACVETTTTHTCFSPRH
jgi:hypothetical protein